MIPVPCPSGQAENPIQSTRFVGVTVNMPDCLSGPAGSTPVRTANLLSSVTASISVFDTDGFGSNPNSTATCWL